MKLRQGLIWAVLVLMLALTACAGLAAGKDASTGPASGADSSQPSADIPNTLPLQTPVSPAEPGKELTEEDVRALFTGSETVRSVEQHEGGWLVCYSEEYSLLYDWVFPSGARCGFMGYYKPENKLEGKLEDQVEVKGPGRVVFYRTSRDMFNEWLGVMPEIVTQEVAEGLEIAFSRSEPTYLPLETPWIFGWGYENDFAESLLGEPDAVRVPVLLYHGRFEQLYQARLGVQGLECAFIPDASSQERFQSFFPTYTTIPGTKVTFDPDSRQLTIHMCATALSSGALTEEVAGDAALFEKYSPCYPCTIPEGSLGEGGPWITDAQIRQEEWSTLITLTLADEVVGYRLDWNSEINRDIGDSSIPCFRLEFTNRTEFLFPEDKLP